MNAKRVGFEVLRFPGVNTLAELSFSILRKLGLGPQDFIFPYRGNVKISDRPGNFSFFMTSDGRDTIASRIRQYGIEGFEPEVQPIFKAIVPHVCTFIDIGANSGFYSLLAAGLNPTCRIFAFEPMPSGLETLEQNIALNGFAGRITAHRAALSNENRGGSFYIPKGVRLPTGGSELNSAVEETEEVPCDFMRLDDFVSREGINEIGFIKIDTERTENLVIEGAIESIRRFRPVMVVEILNDKVGAGIEGFLNGLDYRFYQIGAKGIRATPSLQVGGLRGKEWNFLLVPAERENLIESLPRV